MKKMEITTEDGKKTRRDFLKEWRKRHKERAREHSRRHLEKVAEQNRQKEQENSTTYRHIDDKVEMR